MAIFFCKQEPDKTQADCRASARLVNGNTVCDSMIAGVRGVKGGNAGDGGDGGKSGEWKHVIRGSGLELRIIVLE